MFCGGASLALFPKFLSCAEAEGMLKISWFKGETLEPLYVEKVDTPLASSGVGSILYPRKF